MRLQRIICPNPECGRIEHLASLLEYHVVPGPQPDEVGKTVQAWKLIPESSAKVLPDYVPKGICEDYYEACRIAGASPKAAATLARRCLQGMIRDFWQIKKTNLAAAIRALKNKVEPDEFDAIDAVRKVGSIGAHMEKNVNLIIDVDAGESDKLLRLIEALVDEWYVRRHKRSELLKSVRDIAEQKAVTRKAAGTNAQTQQRNTNEQRQKALNRARRAQGHSKGPVRSEPLLSSA